MGLPGNRAKFSGYLLKRETKKSASSSAYAVGSLSLCEVPLKADHGRRGTEVKGRLAKGKNAVVASKCRRGPTETER
jgi:hypothetical protein